MHAEEIALPVVNVVRANQAAPVTQLSLPGNVQSVTEGPIFARAEGYLVKGYLVKRLADIGDRVKAGQLLAVIDAPDLNTELEIFARPLPNGRGFVTERRAQASGHAQVIMTLCLDQQVTQAKATLDQATASLVQAQANLEQAKANEHLAEVTKHSVIIICVWLRAAILSRAREQAVIFNRADYESISDAVYGAQHATVHAAEASIVAAEQNVKAANGGQKNCGRLPIARCPISAKGGLCPLLKITFRRSCKDPLPYWLCA
jgi:multidrug efflux pump subunit AcrA (membrane-fusion protein)